jgi:crossover junction endodeoxyribonuclease RusA
MTGGDIITLPWPPKELSPNARVHYHTRASHARSYRESAYWLTKASSLTSPDNDDPRDVVVRLDFHPPDARKRDLDNMLASIKSGLDGIADALEVNDQRFALHLHRAPPKKGGQIVVSIA